jgi:hypothetical protein
MISLSDIAVTVSSNLGLRLITRPASESLLKVALSHWQGLRPWNGLDSAADSESVMCRIIQA